MNKENILKIAGSVWSNIINVEDNIYRGELKINSQEPAGICFLDLSNEITFESLGDYQERLLADEYYNHPGALQWNYYLFLLQDTIDPVIKNKIEKDDKYARKYVFDEHGFEDFFNLEASVTQVTSNIVLDWKKTLDAVSLHEVYTDVAYTTGVDNFIQNKPAKKASNAPVSISANQPVINFINRIKLNENYRAYPKKRNFTFGKVNLLKGINGVGKTSLFEAIELIACGRTYRNLKTVEPDNCIEACINGSNIEIEICMPSRSEKYRARDLFWYSNDYLRDNLTATSFNRFNFFNTDAAKDLVNSNNEDDIRKALYNLVLGPDYSFVQERMEGFGGRIRPIYNQLKKEIEDARGKIAASDKIIEQAKKSDSLQALKEAVLNDAKKLRFIDKNWKIDDNTSDADVVINRLNVLLEIFSRDKAFNVDSYEDLQRQKNIQQIKRNKFEEFRIKADNINSIIISTNSELVANEKKEKVLSDALKYFNDPRAFLLKGLSARIAANEKSLKDIDLVKNNIAPIPLQQYSLPIAVGDFSAQNVGELTTARSELTEIEQLMQTGLNKLSKIGQLISQIKALGREYINIHGNPNTCPLCQTDFERTVLMERIDNELTDFPDSNAEINTLVARQNGLRDKIESCVQHNNHIETLRAAYRVIAELVPDEMTLQSLVLEIETLIHEEDECLKTQVDLNALSKWATSFNLSERELLYLEKELETFNIAGHVFSPEGKTLIENTKQDVSTTIANLQNGIKTLSETRTQLSIQVKTDLELATEKEYKPSEIEELFTATDRKLLLLEDTFKKIREIITLDDRGNIADVSNQLSLLAKNLKSLNTAFQSQFALQNATKEKATATAFIESNQNKFEYIENGYYALKTLTANKGTDQLSSFFDQNLKEVSDIFRTIHSPKEFKSIKYKEKQLYLIKEEDSGERKVSEISTGQRAALAIALFISLNRKLKNGPNIILFDDPISHIDDFNALSFLDFLRLFILRENKQIFIATANARLASLIEKKFHFLGNDFVEYELTR